MSKFLVLAQHAIGENIYMNKTLYFILLFLFYSCSTYTTISYQVPPNNQIKKGSTVIIDIQSIDEHRQQIQDSVESNLSTSNYVKVIKKDKTNEGKSDYILKLSNYVEDVSITDSIDENNNRNASALATGSLNVLLKDSNSNIIVEKVVNVTSTATATLQMPKPYSKSSLRPIVNAILDIDPNQRAIDGQNKELEANIRSDFMESLPGIISKEFIPSTESIKIKLDDAEKDLKVVIHLIKKEYFNDAKEYLEALLKEKPNRADINYNLGVINEVLQKKDSAINYYQAAADLNKENILYAEGLASAKLRLEYHKKIRKFSE